MFFSRCAEFNPSAALSTLTINQNRNSSDRFTSCRKQPFQIQNQNIDLTRNRLQEIFAGQKYFCKKKLKFLIEIVIFETRKGKNSETEQTWGSRLECLNISTNWMKIVQDS